MRSRYSRPSASQTRQPDERTIARGTPAAAPPKSASGRLLPVEVNPATEPAHRELQRAERVGGLPVAAEIDPARRRRSRRAGPRGGAGRGASR